MVFRTALPGVAHMHIHTCPSQIDGSLRVCVCMLVVQWPMAPWPMSDTYALLDDHIVTYILTYFHTYRRRLCMSRQYVCDVCLSLCLPRQVIQEVECHVKTTALGRALLLTRDAYKRSTGKDPEKDDQLVAQQTQLPENVTEPVFKARCRVLEKPAW